MINKIYKLEKKKDKPRYFTLKHKSTANVILHIADIYSYNRSNKDTPNETYSMATYEDKEYVLKKSSYNRLKKYWKRYYG
jgi:hypothetical protein